MAGMAAVSRWRYPDRPNATAAEGPALQSGYPCHLNRTAAEGPALPPIETRSTQLQNALIRTVEATSRRNDRDGIAMRRGGSA
jgi:hypothetical protein